MIKHRRPPQRKEPKLNCVLILRKEHAEDLVDLLEKARTSSTDPHRFDKTPLGELLTSLKSGPQ
jgi:hypothetical protein